jgi:glucokinase
MARSSGPRLLADIGGTNARFAWQPGPGAALVDELQWPCDAHASLQDALAHYLRHTGRKAPPACAIGIANPVTGDRVTMTNRDWSFSIEALRTALGFERLLVMNDFKALALALPSLRADEVHRIGGGDEPVPGAAMALVGPGTGLGVATLVPTPAGPVAIDGEGGHVTLAAHDDEEAVVLAWLRRRFGHVSAERVLSGPGLVELHAAARAVAGIETPDLSAAEIVALAGQTCDLTVLHNPESAPDPSQAQLRCCQQALRWFVSFLACVAGNHALSVGARGGVYLGGGIPPRILPALHQPHFRERFESKGRMRDYLRRIPVFVIDATSPPALRGAAAALDM